MTTWAPAMEVTGRDGKLTIRFDVPGIEPPDIHVSITGRTMTISGERKAPAPSDDEWIRGITYGSFARTITLPEAIDATSVRAKHRHGVLEVECTLASASTKRTVPIVVEDKASTTESADLDAARSPDKYPVEVHEMRVWPGSTGRTPWSEMAA